MGRNARIKIQNNTGYPLKYVKEETDIKHGKFQEGKTPPEEIKDSETGVFEVGNRTGAKIGPEGTVVYKATISVKDIAVDLKVHLYWNHPFSSAKSVYTASSVPVGFTSFSLLPAKPEGHDQTVTIIVNFQNLLDLYDIHNWMKYINGNRKLSELTIPGTHDSGAVKGGSLYECQTMSIPDQLLKGIRFLDIRCRLKDGVLEICHGETIPYYMDKTFDEVIEDCKKFLRDHPNESIIMSVKQEGGKPIGNKAEKIIRQYNELWYLENEIPSLQTVRGKIILFRRFEHSDKIGIDASTGWQDNNPSFWLGNGQIHVQDKYKVYYTIPSINNKWEEIKGSFEASDNNNALDKLFVNFTSGSGGIAPVDLASRGVLGTKSINGRVYETVSQINKARYGIIVMDFPENPNELFLPQIIGLNHFE